MRASVMRVLGKHAGFALSLVCIGGAFGGAAVMTAADSLRRFEVAVVREQPVVIAAAAVARAEVLSNDEWFSSLRSEKSWSNRRNAAPAAAPAKGNPGKGPLPPQPQPWGFFGGMFGGPDDDMPLLPAAKAPTGGYRTVCVRMCDGYFFPISFSTTRERFAADEAACQSRCSGDARLFVYRNPGEEPESMVDLSGRPYGKMKTAFLYRTAYDASCKCTPHPWEQEARLKHRVYALEAERRKGNKKAVAELKDIKAAMSKTAAASETPRKGKSSKKTAVASASAPGPAGVPVAAAGASPAAPVTAAQPAAGSLKGADPALTPPVAPAQRVAYGSKPMQKAMRLGAPPSPASKPSGGDWQRKALNGGGLQ